LQKSSKRWKKEKTSRKKNSQKFNGLSGKWGIVVVKCVLKTETAVHETETKQTQIQKKRAHDYSKTRFDVLKYEFQVHEAFSRLCRHNSLLRQTKSKKKPDQAYSVGQSDGQYDEQNTDEKMVIEFEKLASDWKL